jgi:hypothetical protein
VEAVLLILVLSAGDPESARAAAAVAEALRQQEPAAQVVLPPESAKLLAARGMRDGDLVSRSEKPVQATAADLHLVLVRVERRESGSDRVVDIDLWSGGRIDRMSTAVGQDTDPLPLAAEGARRLLRESAHDPVAAADRADIEVISDFADRGDWKGLVASVDARSDARPRLRHAAIMARLRLGDHAGAVTALEAMRAKLPDHPLTKAAAAAVESDVGGSDTLRDGVPVDATDNVLR